MMIRLFTVLWTSIAAALTGSFSATAVMAQTTDIGTLDKEAAEKALQEALLALRGPQLPDAAAFRRHAPAHVASMDAGAFGCRLGPRDAYRFAKGEEVIASMGERVKAVPAARFPGGDRPLRRPGLLPAAAGRRPRRSWPTRKGRKWYTMISEGKGADAAVDIITSFCRGPFPKASRARHAGLPQGLARHHRGGRRGQRARPLHRLHRLRVDLEHRRQQPAPQRHLPRQRRQGRPVEPLITLKPLGSDNPRDLWKWMAAYEEKTGGNVLAIAHNGNLSNGRMFPIVDSFTGKPIDREYAENRARWEPLYEATQIKGDGETHPFLSPNDEFAAFERWDKGNLDLSELKKNEMLEYEYARSALKNGLKLEKELGVNPYKFGMIGSTDSHTGLATADQDNFFGKTSSSEPSPTRATHPFIKTDKADHHGLGDSRLRLRRRLGHRQHPRRDLRRHGARARPTPPPARAWPCASSAAGTSRPRMRNDRMPAPVGYAKGVPMGGDLNDAPHGKSPTFLVAASKDPIGANLDRIQVIKGWLDKDGELHEKDLRRGVVRRPQARREDRQAAAGGQHGGRGGGDLDEHHRRPRADHGLEGPGLRSRRSGPSTTSA